MKEALSCADAGVITIEDAKPLHNNPRSNIHAKGSPARRSQPADERFVGERNEVMFSGSRAKLFIGSGPWSARRSRTAPHLIEYIRRLFVKPHDVLNCRRGGF